MHHFVRTQFGVKPVECAESVWLTGLSDGAPSLAVAGGWALRYFLLHFFDGPREIDHKSKGRLARLTQQANNFSATADQLHIGPDYDEMRLGKWVLRASPSTHPLYSAT